MKFEVMIEITTAQTIEVEADSTAEAWDAAEHLIEAEGENGVGLRSTWKDDSDIYVVGVLNLDAPGYEEAHNPTDVYGRPWRDELDLWGEGEEELELQRLMALNIEDMTDEDIDRLLALTEYVTDLDERFADLVAQTDDEEDEEDSEPDERVLTPVAAEVTE